MKNITFALLLLGTGFCQAQNGVGVFDDKVGIGIDSPLSQLDIYGCLLYTSPSPRDQRGSRMPSSA